MKSKFREWKTRDLQKAETAEAKILFVSKTHLELTIWFILLKDSELVSTDSQNYEQFN